MPYRPKVTFAAGALATALACTESEPAPGVGGEGGIGGSSSGAGGASGSDASAGDGGEGGTSGEGAASGEGGSSGEGAASGEGGTPGDGGSQGGGSSGTGGSGASDGGSSGDGGASDGGSSGGGGASDGGSSGGGGSSGEGGAREIFSSDIESTTLAKLFVDVNQYGGIEVSISTDVAHSGSHAIKLTYSSDEAGVELKPAPFSPTVSLFVRKYEYYAPGWEGNWPVGLKTSRCFTREDWSTGSVPDAHAYISEKLIWQTYSGDPDDEFARGLNNAILDLDIEATYSPSTLFGNGLPFIRTEHWYKMETWLVLNSAVDAADGVMQVWIDDQSVLDRRDIVWRSTSRGVPNGDAWQSMWFGGNYSGAVFGEPSEPVHRYIDDIYLSETLDR